MQGHIPGYEGWNGKHRSGRRLRRLRQLLPAQPALPVLLQQGRKPQLQRREDARAEPVGSGRGDLGLRPYPRRDRGERLDHHPRRPSRFDRSGTASAESRTSSGSRSTPRRRCQTDSRTRTTTRSTRCGRSSAESARRSRTSRPRRRSGTGPTPTGRRRRCYPRSTTVRATPTCSRTSIRPASSGRP